MLPDWVNALTVRRGESEVVVAGCKDGGLYVVGWEAGVAESDNVKKLVIEK